MWDLPACVCTALYCTVLHCTVLYCTALYCTVLYSTVLYCTALHCTALYCTVLYCTVLYCTVPYCPAFSASQVPCASHKLNNIAKCILNGLDPDLTQLFEKGPGLLHAKKYAARRRRWFAYLRSVGANLSLPPKYISTRWCIWRNVCTWWFDYYDHYRRFLEKEKQRYKEGDCPTNIQEVLNILNRRSAEKKATMVFVQEATEDLCTLINESQVVTAPTAPSMAYKVAATCDDIKTAAGADKFHPRVVEALQSVKDIDHRTRLRTTFRAALSAVQNKFDEFIVGQKELLKFWEKISVLDPRNLKGYPLVPRHASAHILASARCHSPSTSTYY